MYEVCQTVAAVERASHRDRQQSGRPQGIAAAGGPL
jgi:hypothetical protein